MKPKLFFILYFIFCWYAISAQNIMFQKTYGCSAGTGIDWGQSIQQTIDGGYVLAGYSDGFTNGTDDFYLVKTDSNGDTLWTKIYVTINEDEAFSVRQTTDGGYIVTGFSDNISTHNNIVLIKTYSNGSVQWYKTFVGTNYEQAYSVQQTFDGGYIISGSIYTVTPSDYNIYLIKTNSDGDTLWTKTFGGTMPEEGYSIEQTTDAGYIIVGYSYSSMSAKDVYLIKTNSTGDTLWTKTYGGTKDDQGNSVKQTVDGGYIITGYTKSVDTTVRQVYLIKTNSNGDTLWTKAISSMNSVGSQGNSVVQTTDNGYAIAGWHAFTGQLVDAYLVKTNSNGDTLWTKTFGGTNSDWAESIEQTLDDGFVLLGSTDSYDMYQHFYLIKTDSLGNAGPFPVVGLIEQEQQVVAGKINIYPNPFTAQANLVLSEKIDLSNSHELRVYDVLGNETTRAIITAHRAVIGRDNLAAGLYFCKVVSNNTILATGKFIIH